MISLLAACYGLFTRRITRSELEQVKDKICNLPTTFQKFIEKRSELRVTCVADQVFACRIEAHPGDLTADDYRFDAHNLNHAACKYPELHERLREYMRELQINFACFDFIVPHEGEPVFLEANCNGQWLWVQNLTGLPIGRAIADELLASCGRIKRPDRLLPRGTAGIQEFTIANAGGKLYRSDYRNE